MLLVDPVVIECVSIAGADGAEGSPGVQGPKGDDGAQGLIGPQGPAGEVTAQQFTDGLAAVTANSSANTNALSTLDTPFADPDMEAMRAKINELLATLRR